MRERLWVFGICGAVIASCGPLSSPSSSEPGAVAGMSGANDGGSEGGAQNGGDGGSSSSGAGENQGATTNLGGAEPGAGAGTGLADSGSAGEGGAPGEGGAGGAGEPSGPLTIATDQVTPTGIAVDANYVYWANRDAKTIVRCKKSGCPASGPTLLASTSGLPLGITLDATRLYWIEATTIGVDQMGRVFECPISGCVDPPTLLVDWVVDNRTNGLHVADGTLYIAAWPMLGTCSIAGCDTPTTIVRGPFVSVDTDAQYLYGARYGGGNVVRCPIVGCMSDGTDTVTLIGSVTPLAVAIDESHVYFADHDYFSGAAATKHQIARCPLAGCPEELPAELVRSGDDVSPYALALSATRLYFTNVTQGSVVSIPKP